MKNKYLAPTFRQDCLTATVIKVKSNWLAMCASYAGWMVVVVFVFGMLLLIRQALFAALAAVGFLVTITIVYFPRQWMTALTVNLADKTFTVVSPFGTRVLPFSEVTQIVHQGIATLFATNYLWWAEVNGKRFPLVAFSNQPASLDFFLMLSRRTNLALHREEGN
jgi:hypothetical protein